MQSELARRTAMKIPFMDGGGKSALPRVKSSIEWHAYFTTNSRRQRRIPWHLGAGASADELSAVVGSLRAWQLGESSDGSHLLAAAGNYATKVQDPDFVDVVQLFIAEEQRHGEMLGRFLDLAGVPRAESNWGDTLFRLARYSLPSMEVWATPVVMVETHALIYYNAIRQATKSLVLRTICAQILSDEVPHIRFQCERLAILHFRRPRLLRVLTMAAHRLMFTAITIAIWLGHRRALRAGGYSFARFWRSAWSKMKHAWRQMAPEAYAWKDSNAKSAPSPKSAPESLPTRSEIVSARIRPTNLPHERTVDASVSS
jgi:hypothetical protein